VEGTKLADKDYDVADVVAVVVVVAVGRCIL
jgi:hypothetical protein